MVLGANSQKRFFEGTHIALRNNEDQSNHHLSVAIADIGDRPFKPGRWKQFGTSRREAHKSDGRN